MKLPGDPEKSDHRAAFSGICFWWVLHSTGDFLGEIVAASTYRKEVIDSCTSDLDVSAGRTGAIGDQLGSLRIDDTALGQLDAASKLVGAVREFGECAGREFDAAQRRLRGAAAELDAAHNTMREIDEANAADIQVR